jgi:hypothetical protein
MTSSQLIDLSAAEEKQSQLNTDEFLTGLVLGHHVY